jgi:hypothetical protein
MDLSLAAPLANIASVVLLYVRVNFSSCYVRRDPANSEVRRE